MIANELRVFSPVRNVQDENCGDSSRPACFHAGLPRETQLLEEGVKHETWHD